MNTFKVVLTIVALVVLQGCGSLSSVSGDRSITYDEDFDTIVETVEQAIRGSSLNISYAEESDEGDKYTIVFYSQANVSNESVQQDEAEVVVEHLGKDQTKVIITNPEYHYSVPTHRQKEYDRILKNKIDDILES